MVREAKPMVFSAAVDKALREVIEKMDWNTLCEALIETADRMDRSEVTRDRIDGILMREAARRLKMALNKP